MGPGKRLSDGKTDEILAPHLVDSLTGTIEVRDDEIIAVLDRVEDHRAAAHFVEQLTKAGFAVADAVQDGVACGEEHPGTEHNDHDADAGSRQSAFEERFSYPRGIHSHDDRQVPGRQRLERGEEARVPPGRGDRYGGIAVGRPAKDVAESGVFGTRVSAGGVRVAVPPQNTHGFLNTSDQKGLHRCRRFVVPLRRVSGTDQRQRSGFGHFRLGTPFQLRLVDGLDGAGLMPGKIHQASLVLIERGRMQHPFRDTTDCDGDDGHDQEQQDEASLIAHAHSPNRRRSP